MEKAIKLTKLQQPIVDWAANEKGHAFVNSSAGTGKSTVLTAALLRFCEVAVKNPALVRDTRWRDKIVAISFNSHSVRDLKKKLDKYNARINARTVHSLGRGSLFTGLRVFNLPIKELPEPDETKYRKIAEDYFSSLSLHENFRNTHDIKELIKQLRKLVDFARLTLMIPPSAGLQLIAKPIDKSISYTNKETGETFGLEAILRDLAEKFNSQIEIDFNDEDAWYYLWNGVLPCIEDGAESYKETGCYDHTDSLFLPWYLDIPAKKHLFMAVDECQDFNRSMLETVMRALTPQLGRLLWCGDPDQSIYRFTGADSRACEIIKARCNAVQFELNETFRCPKSHVRLAQQIKPRIVAWEGQQEGEIYLLRDEEVSRKAKPGMYFICRCTAPLVKRWLALVKDGIKAIVLGRDLGKMFTELLEKLEAMRGFSFQTLPDLADRYYREQSKVLENEERSEMLLALLYDKVETLKALREGYLFALGEQAAQEYTNSFTDAPVLPSLDSLKRHIEDFFKPDTDHSGKEIDYSQFVILMSIHKSKGLEADEVMLERPDLMPHPSALEDDEYDAELCAEFVALTRAKKILYFIESIPDNIDWQPPKPVIEEEVPAPATPAVIEQQVALPHHHQGSLQLALPEEVAASFLEVVGQARASAHIEQLLSVDPRIFKKIVERLLQKYGQTQETLDMIYGRYPLARSVHASYLAEVQEQVLAEAGISLNGEYVKNVGVIYTLTDNS